MAEQRKVALVTGGSRGIGMACAINLAKKGFDVAAASRTLHTGEAHEQSASIHNSDFRAMPGSLEETAAECEKYGVKALPVKMDLLDRAEIKDGVEKVLKTFGRIDVLVNNGRYYGPGQMDLFVDTDMEYFDKANEANVMAPLLLTKLCLPSMIENGGGIIVNLTSSSGSREVAALPGKGGWGLNYSFTKAAIARITWGLAKEFKQYNVAVINMSPGDVVVERRVHEASLYGFSANFEQGLRPDIPGIAVAFFASHPQPMYFSGKDHEALDICLAHNLVDPETVARRHGMDAWGLPK